MKDRFNFKGFEILVMDTIKELRENCCNTDWCVGKNDADAKAYIAKGPVILVKRDGKPICLMSEPIGQFRNPSNHFISLKNIKMIIPVIRELYKRGYLSENIKQHQKKGWKDFVNPLLIIENKSEIAKDPWLSLFYARDILKKRWKKGEEAIASKLETAYRYVVDVIKSPFPLGEKIFNENLHYKDWYSSYVNEYKARIKKAAARRKKLRKKYLAKLAEENKN